MNNSDIPNTPNRYPWEHPLVNSTSTNILVLNSDIALVRNLIAYLNASTGEVTYAFLCRNGNCSVPNKGRPACPYASDTSNFVAQYKHDMLLWLNVFKTVFRKMLVHGYDTSTTGTNIICPLTKVPTSNPVTAKPIGPIPKPTSSVTKPTALIPKPAAPVTNQRPLFLS